MTDLQEKLLGLLCEIDDICKKHDISYCLFAGTSLGVERHGGFIPWDDDADIIMTYDNYKRFLEVAPHEMKEGRVLNALELDNKEYPFTYARYVDTNTCAVQRHTSFGNCDPGIKIDIFYVVPTYDDLIKAEKHRLEILAFSEVICSYGVMINYRPDGFEKYFNKEAKMFRRLGRERYVNKRMDQLILDNNVGSKHYVLFSGMMSNSYILDRRILDEVEYVDFEDKRLPISSHNIDFSRELYGEGWINKPGNLEKPRHTMLLDMDKSYSGYLDALWDEINYDQTKALVLERKEMHLMDRDAYKDVHVNNQALKNIAAEMNVTKAYLDMDDKNDYNALYNVFKPYYETQLTAINRWYKLDVELDLAIFEKAMNAAIMTGNYYVAADIIRNCLSSGFVAKQTVERNGLKKKIETCSKLIEAVYVEKDWESVRTIIQGIDDELTDSLTVLTAKCWLDINDAKDHDELSELCNKIDDYMERFDYKAELLYLKGLVHEKLGDGSAADKAYEEAVKNIRNGVVYQNLLDKGYGTHGNWWNV